MLGLEPFEMKLELAGELGIEPAPAKQGEQPPPHQSSDAAGRRRNRSIRETVRSQLAASRAICLRPGAVSSYIFALRLLSEMAHRHLIQPRCSSRRSAG